MSRRRKVPLPYRLRDLRADTIMELARRVKPAATGPVEYTISGYFHAAHRGLNLAAGEILRRNKSGSVRVRLDAEAYQVMLESAAYALRSPYRTVQLQTSARRTVKALLDPARPVPADSSGGGAS